jgi:argininosuccinate lyase
VKQKRDEGKAMKMWSGRFRQPLDPKFEKWQRSFPYDRRLLIFELAASQAHANALRKAEVLSGSELSEIIKGLQAIGDRAASSAEFLDDAEAEDVHHFVEKQLVALIGDAGFKLHTGRSRNEQIATDLRLFVRHAIDELRKMIGDWVEVMLARAESAGDAAMPAYTHLQPAEPVLVAHWLLAYVEMFLRDASRLDDCRARSNFCPLGSGAVAGATVALDREAIAAELGFKGPTANSMDATSDRDFAVEVVDGLSLIAIHLSRWAEEMILFSTPAYGFVELPEAYSTGSSAMPQKKNPDLLELVRGKSARVMGCGTTLRTLIKGLPLAYNKDLQETQEAVFEACDTVRDMFPKLTSFMKLVQFNVAKMEQEAKTGYMNAWAAASFLVRRGVPSRLAHEAVGKAVALATERGCELQALPLADMQNIHSSFDEELYSCLELPEVLALHDVAGGTAPSQVRRALASVRERLATISDPGTSAR